MTTTFRLRELLEGREEPLSLAKLARESGLSYATVHAIYHNDTARVDLSSLDALAAVLGVGPGDLLERVPEKRSRRT